MLPGKRYGRTPEERFWEKVKKAGPDECWEWQAAKQHGGYGFFGIAGKSIKAHRFSWELANGPIPKGEGYHGTCVCHKCDNPSCVNPNHLFLGTNKDNADDRDAKGRCKAKGPLGERSGRSKLKAEQVVAIRNDGRKVTEIARAYGVGHATIHRILNRICWAHI